MAEHKFEFTVSGFDLSEETKLHISQEIAAAVAKMVIARHPGEVGGILNGRIKPTEAAYQNVPEFWKHGGMLVDIKSFEAGYNAAGGQALIHTAAARSGKD